MSLNNLNFLSQGYQLGFIVIALSLFFIIMRLAQLTSEYNTLIEETSRCVTEDQMLELVQGVVRHELSEYGLVKPEPRENQFPDEPKPSEPLEVPSKESTSSKTS